MATQLIVEKMGGSFLSPSLPVFVYNDDYSSLSLAAAEAAISAAFGGQIPITANTLPPDGNPGHQQLSKSAYRFTINYREPNRRSPAPPTSGVIRPRIDAIAMRKEVRWAPERACYVDSSLASILGGSLLSFSPFRGMVNVQFTGLLAVNFGAVIDPPEPNLGVEMTVPTTSVTPSWRRTVALCVGRVNSTPLSSGTYSAGEIFLHSVHLQIASETECSIQIAWSYKPNVTGESRGPITGVAYHGHDFVWEKPKILIDDSRNLALPLPEMVIVNKVWPETDLSSIGISPPS
jgi:hypothetical protein